MKQMFSNLDFETNGQGFTNITQDINLWIINNKLKRTKYYNVKHLLFTKMYYVLIKRCILKSRANRIISATTNPKRPVASASANPNNKFGNCC